MGARGRGSARKSLAAIVVGALALIAVLGSTALGVTVKEGNLEAEIEAKFQPTKLPKGAPAGIGLTVEGKLKAVDGTHPPALKTLSLQFDKHGHLFTKGLPTCTTGQLANTLTSAAKASCGDALVGTGRVGAEIAFPEQAPFQAHGPLLIFNGAPKGGKQVLIFHVYAKVPAPTTFVTTALISKTGGVYGTTADVKIPTIVGGQGSLTTFKATIPKKTWSYKGKKESLLSASCPTGKLFAHGDFSFSGGITLSGKVQKTCQPAG